MLRLAIATTKKEGYSQTFIHAHLTKLPAQIFHIYSRSNAGYLPIYNHEDKPFLTDNPLLNKLEMGIEKYTGLGYQLRKQAIKKYFERHNIQAVLAEYGPTGIYLMEICEELNIPLTVHFHGYDAYRYVTLEKYAEKYKTLFQKAATIIAVSKDMEAQLLALGAKKETLAYCPYGPNDDLFTYHDAGQNPPTLLAVGRFTQKKSPQLTIKAFAEAAKQVDNLKLVMLGDGPLWEECKDLAKTLGISNRITFFGRATHEEVSQQIQKSRAFIQHSVRAKDGDSEGTPVAILEASASGLPIIATRHAGIKDVVIEGKTGFLVDEQDWQGMIAPIVKIAKEPKLATKMGKAAADRVRQHFSMNRHITQLWQIIESKFNV